MARQIKLYVCGTAPLDIDLGAKDIKFYMSEEMLKKYHSCVRECGIVEYTLDLDTQKITQDPLPYSQWRDASKGEDNG